MYKEQEIDITQTIKIIERLKSQLISDVAMLYSNMSDTKAIGKDENANVLADIITISYLLGQKLGVPYEDLDKKAKEHIKLEILEGENMSYWQENLSDLYKHLGSTKHSDIDVF